MFLAGLKVTRYWFTSTSLVRTFDDLTRVNQAFFNVNIVISMGLLAVLLIEIGLAQWW